MSDLYPDDQFILSDTEYDSAGELVNPSRYDMNMVYTTGVLTSQWFTDGFNTWTKTFTYSGSDVVKISRWVRT